MEQVGVKNDYSTSPSQMGASTGPRRRGAKEFRENSQNHGVCRIRCEAPPSAKRKR